MITGLSIQSQGWKSVYYNPARAGFLGVAGNTLDQILVQHKRWSEGDLQILLSQYSPAWYGLGRIHIGLTMGYLTYCLWSPNCLAVLYYAIIPSLYLLKGIPLFPQVCCSLIGLVFAARQLFIFFICIIPCMILNFAFKFRSEVCGFCHLPMLSSRSTYTVLLSFFCPAEHFWAGGMNKEYGFTKGPLPTCLPLLIQS